MKNTNIIITNISIEYHKNYSGNHYVNVAVIIVRTIGSKPINNEVSLPFMNI